MAEEKKWRPEGGDEEEEDEADELAYKSAKDAVLFAIEGFANVSRTEMCLLPDAAAHYFSS
jgi:hypothetical protein